MQKKSIRPWTLKVPGIGAVVTWLSHALTIKSCFSTAKVAKTLDVNVPGTFWDRTILMSCLFCAYHFSYLFFRLYQHLIRAEVPWLNKRLLIALIVTFFTFFCLKSKKLRLLMGSDLSCGCEWRFRARIGPVSHPTDQLSSQRSRTCGVQWARSYAPIVPTSIDHCGFPDVSGR